MWHGTSNRSSSGGGGGGSRSSSGGGGGGSGSGTGSGSGSGTGTGSGSGIGWRRLPSNASLIFLIFQILNGIPSLPCRSLPSCRKSVVMFGSSVSSTLFLGSA